MRRWAYIIFSCLQSAVNLIVSPTRFRNKGYYPFFWEVTIENFGGESLEVTVDKKKDPKR